jgi:hypothetical protein
VESYAQNQQLGDSADGSSTSDSSSASNDSSLISALVA